METLITGILIIIAYTLGLKLGKGVSSNEKAQIPFIEPIKAYLRGVEETEINEEQEKLNRIYQNIENYDGTDNGQEEV